MFEFLINHIHQKQCIAWYTIACLATVFGFHHPAQLFDGKFSPAYLHQCTNYGAHHIAQETVGADSETPLITTHILPMGFGDGAIIGLGIRIGF